MSQTQEESSKASAKISKTNPTGCKTKAKIGKTINIKQKKVKMSKTAET